MEGVLVVLDVGACEDAPLRAPAGVFESITRVRGVAGTAELVLAEPRGTLSPPELERERIVRAAPLEASAAPLSGAVRALRTERSASEPDASTRLPRAL
ncbi:MAG: hypothetical protein R6V12_06680 [Candidatus Hydrogenedentota bacterium]